MFRLETSELNTRCNLWSWPPIARVVQPDLNSESLVRRAIFSSTAGQVSVTKLIGHVRVNCNSVGMSSPELQEIPHSLKKKVKDILGPYFTRNYGDDVRNSVLLLNFLHQHSVISKPVYEIHHDPAIPFHFIGSCSLSFYNTGNDVTPCAVGTLKTGEVQASSKKKCKKEAAQKILNLLLEDEKMDIMNSCDSIEWQIQSININGDSDLDERMEYGYEIKPFKNNEIFYEDDLSGILLFDDMNMNNRTESRNSKKRESSNHSSVEMDRFYADREFEPYFSSSSQNGNTKLASTKCLNGKKAVNVDDPRCVTPNDGSQTKISPSSSAVISGKQGMTAMKSARPLNSFVQGCSESAVKSGSSTSSLSSLSSSQSLEDQGETPRTHSYHCEKVLVSNNFCSDFFDPFSRLRPKIKCQSNASRKEQLLNVEKRNSTGEVASSYEGLSKFPSELIQNSKTPFQILQEKAVKNFKLIPRSRIEKTDNGFACTLILDTHSGYGEGRTKKEAKLKASTYLLQVLDSIQ